MNWCYCKQDNRLHSDLVLDVALIPQGVVSLVEALEAEVEVIHKVLGRFFMLGINHDYV